MFLGTLWQDAKCFLIFMWKAGFDGWRWTFMPPSGPTVRAVPPVSGILWSVSLTVDCLARSGGFCDGGGFGAGSGVDVSATGRTEWQFARHFGIAMGYGGIHFSKSNTVAGRTLTISPTLHGPIFGFGIFF